MQQTNLGANGDLNLTSFSGTVTLLVNGSSHSQQTASAEECCMACALSTDANSLNTEPATVQALVQQQIPVGCNI